MKTITIEIPDDLARPGPVHRMKISHVMPGWLWPSSWYNRGMISQGKGALDDCRPPRFSSTYGEPFCDNRRRSGLIVSLRRHDDADRR